MRTTFVVGRLTSRSAEIVVVDPHRPPPIPGPWVLRALVRPSFRPSKPRDAADRPH
jgi:hypothetical protein